LIGAPWLSTFGQAAPVAAQQSQGPTAPAPSQPMLSAGAQTPPIQQPPLAPPPPVRPAAPTAPIATEAPPIQEQRGAGPVRKLSLDEAVILALEQNLDVQVERINPQLQDLQIEQVAGFWKPNLGGQLNFGSATTPPDTLFAGAEDAVTVRRLFGTVGIDQVLPFGTSYSVGWDASRQTSNNVFASFNPRLGSSVSFALTQPLMRGLRIDGTRANYMVQKNNRLVSDILLRAQIVQTMRLVRNAYWTLVGARYNLVVTQASLDIARQTLKDNKTRVEVGTMAPIDIVQAEAEVARNEEAAIVAAAQIDQAEDQLRALVFDPRQPDFWTMDLDLTEPPQLPTEKDVDIEGAVRNALSKRTDLLQFRKNLESAQINIRFYGDQLRPTLNATVDYGLNALGGVQVQRAFNPDNPFEPGDIIAESEKGFGSVLGDLFGLDFPQWTFGAIFSYPLGRSTQKAQYARARLAYTQSELALRSQELSVTTEVRSVGRNVNTNRRRVDSTRVARLLTERQLEAAQKKFSVGLATSLDVLIAQRDLTNARTTELTAIIDYVKSLVDFEAVQETSTGGGGGGGGFATTP
jgi:outer membrane protein TolC